MILRKSTIWILLILILVGGAFLRLNHLNDKSLWLDEGITYYNSSGEGFLDVWDKASKLDQSPPFYYFIMHEVLDVFGENEFIFRLVPVVFAVLSILFLYLLIGMMISEEAGLISAFLLAINPFHIGFSVESRMYVLLSLEAIMAFYFLYKAFFALKRNYLSWVWFTLISAIGLYTHNFFFFILAACFCAFWLFFAISEKKSEKFLLGALSGLTIVALYIPWFFSLIRQLGVERYWMVENSVSNVKEYFLDFSNGNLYLLFGFIAIALFGLVWSIFKRKTLDYGKSIVSIVSLFVFIFVGLCAPLFYSLMFEPIMKIRYMVYLVPFFMGLVGIGIYAFRRYSIVFLVALLSLFVAVFVPWQESKYPVEFGEDFRGLVDVVNEKPATLVVHTPSIAHVINFYNSGKFEVKPFPYSDDLTKFNIDESYKSKFRDLIRPFSSFYLAITHTHENPPGLLKTWSDEFCSDMNKIEVVGIDSYYFTGCR